MLNSVQHGGNSRSVYLFRAVFGSKISVRIFGSIGKIAVDNIFIGSGAYVHMKHFVQLVRLAAVFLRQRGIAHGKHHAFGAYSADIFRQRQNGSAVFLGSFFIGNRLVAEPKIYVRLWR